MKEKKDKTLLVVGILAVVGVAAYFIFIKPPSPPPPPGDVSAQINSFTITT